ncbi:MAG: WXG100 family type VII secretion target [Pseudonocardiaceae bacterium]
MANVNVTYEEMKDAGNRLKAGMDDIESRLDQLKQQVHQLVEGGYVTDTSSGQFRDSYQEFDTGARKMVHGLEDMNTYLQKAAEAFRQTDEDLSRQLSH